MDTVVVATVVASGSNGRVESIWSRVAQPQGAKDHNQQPQLGQATLT